MYNPAEGRPWRQSTSWSQVKVDGGVFLFPRRFASLSTNRNDNAEAANKWFLSSTFLEECAPRPPLPVAAAHQLIRYFSPHTHIYPCAGYKTKPAHGKLALSIQAEPSTLRVCGAQCEQLQISAEAGQQRCTKMCDRARAHGRQLTEVGLRLLYGEKPPLTQPFDAKSKLAAQLRSSQRIVTEDLLRFCERGAL